jgi:hypothetical protein
MKKILLATAILLSTQLFAQKTHNTAYGALTTQYSRFNGENAIFTGAYGGLFVRQKLMVGLGVYGLVTQHKGYGLNAATHEPNNFRMGYGGLMAEYAILDKDRLHVTASALAGGGILKNGHGRGTIPENGSDELKDIDATGFYVLQPSAQVEYDVTNWFRVGATAGYRYVTGSDQAGISDRKMSAPTAGLTFKFGSF